MNLKQFVRIQRLHLFTDGTDTVAAYDEVDAVEVWEEYTEDSRDIFADPFAQVPDREIYKISYDSCDFRHGIATRPLFSKIEPGDGYGIYSRISAPAWMWALHEGRGFVCSTEW
jgi:hypothetical protein